MTTDVRNRRGAYGSETDGGSAGAWQSDLFRGVFHGPRLQPGLQALARQARADLSAIPCDDGAVGTRWCPGQGYRRKAAPRLRHADAAAQAAGGRRTRQAHAQHRRRTPDADRADAEGSRASRTSESRATGDPGELGLLGG